MTDLADRRGAGTEVYQPAEDTHLLADAAVGEIPSRARVLDVGTGSGYVAATVRDETGADVVGADLNPFAVRQAADRGVPVVRSDLVSPFRADAFDVVVFNPPYLPRDEDAERDDWMEVALSGGETGREVVEDFFDTVGRVLAPEGFALVLVSTLTGVEEVVEYAGERGFSAAAIREESFPFETLTVLKLRR
ncbi:HemK2/MTQ2 family protein methyltransferase [Halobacterium jilantaiense]|uniref:Release factor glutamine methyltransferase n=1 Tax=Halobacterium jilantaiense TaxID=355548 RepID=A0A1I0QUA3_9EURY|nr:HemK2/MTQ2 family protein methyltransferase [Halobacterium jilantaiense]SEW30866.1 release factor glutamine methyltransferase [Halobacterium jilantaiense]